MSSNMHASLWRTVNKVCSSGGVEPLLKLLHSSNEEVMKNALWLLMICAQSPQVSEEACRLG